MNVREADRTSSAAAVWIVLLRAHREVLAFLQSGVTMRGINRPDFELMEALLHKGPLSTEELQGKLRVADGTIVASAKRLETRGFVSRFARKKGQSTPFELTPEGREFIADVFAEHERDIATLLSILSNAEQSQLRGALKKIGRRSEELMKARFAAQSRRLAPWQIRRAVEMMTGKNSKIAGLGDVAAEIGLSESHFRRAFKTATGVPPHQYRVEARIARAQELLRTGTLPLSEIATSTGFSDQSHFSRVFHKLVGVTPRNWQRENRL